MLPEPAAKTTPLLRVYSSTSLLVRISASVGNDLYDIKGKAEWVANEALYKAHPGKPYSFPEWGLWGIDDPVFIKKMADFVRSHKRTEMLAYFESVPGSIFDLQAKPLSKAAYRRYITPLG